MIINCLLTRIICIKLNVIKTTTLFSNVYLHSKYFQPLFELPFFFVAIYEFRITKHTRLVKLIITPHNQACKTFKCLVVSVGTLLTS